MPPQQVIFAHLKALSRALLIYAAAFLLLNLIAIAISFPWDVDPQADESSRPALVDFYKKAYSAETVPGAEGADPMAPLTDGDKSYADFVRREAINLGIPQLITGLVKQYGLGDKKVLEVGAGGGLLQDLVPDYTALDISPTARRFFHKPFVQASATEMPFREDSFDALWSVWVLEHIPNPEKALLEMRRVVKNGGYLILRPAWEVDRYAGQGCAVRPYSDFDWRGKLLKTGSRVMQSNGFHFLQYHQIRSLRSLGSRLGRGPSRLHFIRLTPNYDRYWVADSDAVTSLSLHEMYLWFTTRGDVCLSCPSEADLVFRDPGIDYMVVQVRKQR